MKVVIPKEVAEHEKRVAATPETIKKMITAGLEVWVQSGAGTFSSIPDEEYEKAGARIAKTSADLYRGAEVVLKVQKPVKTAAGEDEVESLPEGCLLIGFLQPLIDQDLVKRLAKRRIVSLSMEMIPRIARAQRIDALSSQSNVAGYKAVLMGANELGKMMPLMMTAAGTITAAKVLVIGAGVAGLQAVATARRLGAVVEAFDTRPAVKEQVESLGGRFVSVEMNPEQAEDKGGYAKELSKDAHAREMELIAKHAQNADMVVTTALIPGKKAPLLITRETVENMRPGSVIVDLASENGGNCELTKPGEKNVVNGVTILGYYNIPSLMAAQSSQLYARNIAGLFLDGVKEGKLALKRDDEVIQGALITAEGKVVHPALQALNGS